MGNCINTRAILADDQKTEQQRELKRLTKTSGGRSSTFSSAKNFEKTKEKTVRFRPVQEDANFAGGNYRETKSGVVRIRLVLRQNELNQILNGGLKHSSAEQFLNIIKSRSIRVSPDGSIDADKNENNWIPSLESIPEDH